MLVGSSPVRVPALGGDESVGLDFESAEKKSWHPKVCRCCSLDRVLVSLFLGGPHVMAMRPN